TCCASASMSGLSFTTADSPFASRAASTTPLAPVSTSPSTSIPHSPATTASRPGSYAPNRTAASAPNLASDPAPARASSSASIMHKGYVGRAKTFLLGADGGSVGQPVPVAEQLPVRGLLVPGQVAGLLLDGRA